MDTPLIQAMEISSLICLPMAIRAAVDLHVFDVLADLHQSDSADDVHGNNNKGELTAAEILSRVKVDKLLDPAPHPTSDSSTRHAAASSLDRILRVLASRSILTSSSSASDPSVRTYGPTPLSQCLVREQLGPFVLLLTDTFFLGALQHLHAAVLPTHQAQPAVGLDVFAHAQHHPRFNRLFNDGMTAISRCHIAALLDSYHGFDDVSSLVDVGGGTGLTSHLIVSQYPHLSAINFDLPHVIASAPLYPGVQHKGGNMFEELPKADCVFMKFILHDWNDEHCITLLKNCYDALPSHGKVIVMDAITKSELETSLLARTHYDRDLLMLACTTSGQERSEKDFKCLADLCGFVKFQVVCNACELSVMELYRP